MIGDLVDLARTLGLTQVHLNSQSSAIGFYARMDFQAEAGARGVGIPHRRMVLRIGYRDEEQTERHRNTEHLTTVDEYRAAVAEIATRAQRGLAIYTPDLEPQLYDHDLFLEPMKRLVLARSHARVRVLISDPGRVVREGNRFLQMARRLTSYLDLRNVSSEFRGNPCAFIVADDRAIAYRQQASRWDGIVDFDDVNVVRRYMTYFDEAWVGSVIQPELRATAIDF